ncbi:hypothetical protein B2G71_14340 [Novosphingobium sp. PC22D]|uniref:hypothetical protein n=1 Tax=Novosphingobium sp. PC22D TaxID=1962403 RepID=UPI000BEF4461|nr:hypothetical protein [Novosphingobium sp. PC22D]PEQ11956.1 hypothetical protein B2G71_14340 [Novosphingobium sp. PC22D]
MSHNSPRSNKPGRSFTSLKIGVLGVVWICFLVFAFVGLFISGGITIDQNAPQASRNQHDDFAAGSLGTERRARLIAATKLYVEQHQDAPAAMAEGKELAPPEFLNEELARHKQRFRVRKVDGLDADIYEVAG